MNWLPSFSVKFERAIGPKSKSTPKETKQPFFFMRGKKEALSEMEKEVLTHVRNVSKFYVPTKFKD
jgi:spore cortex formation protein SpoVR/YcgB (stage V sporulation)